MKKELVMLYVMFFTACAGMVTCTVNVFAGEVSYTNLFLMLMFSTIAYVCAIIDRDYKSSK